MMLFWWQGVPLAIYVCIYVTLVNPRITPKLIRHKRLSVFVRYRADSKLDSQPTRWLTDGKSGLLARCADLPVYKG